jgi:toxin ParE1/3/4
MRGRVLRTDMAMTDLAEHAEYIRERRPSSAIKFLGAAEATFRQLASMPGIGEPFESKNPAFEGLRCMPISRFPNHIVYYKPLSDGIVVYRLLHGASDRDAAIENEGAE